MSTRSGRGAGGASHTFVAKNAAGRTLFLVASCPAHASAKLGGRVFDQPVMKLMVFIGAARPDVQIIYDQAGSSSADVRDYEPGNESAAMRAKGKIGTARRGQGVDWGKRESVRGSIWFVCYQMRVKAGIEMALQDDRYDEVVVLCIKGGVITQLEQDTVNQIIRDVEGDLSLKGDQMVKPITCHVLDYPRFVEVYDADGTHRQALADKGAAEQEAATEAQQKAKEQDAEINPLMRVSVDVEAHEGLAKEVTMLPREAMPRDMRCLLAAVVLLLVVVGGLVVTMTLSSPSSSPALPFSKGFSASPTSTPTTQTTKSSRTNRPTTLSPSNQPTKAPTKALTKAPTKASSGTKKPTNVKQITAGHSHTCALLNSGTVKCWGWNYAGQLGDGTKLVSKDQGVATPVNVSGLTGVKQIGGGDHHTCAALDSGTVKCWGMNSHGQLGDGSNTESHIPVNVTSLTGVKQIAVGTFHACAALDSPAGTVKCWGYNHAGGLGDGTITNRNTPVVVKGLTGVKNIEQVQGHYTCATLSDSGTAKCWGLNLKGQLGDGTTTNRYTPVNVSGLTGVKQIGGDYMHTCAALDSGTAKCWGETLKGQLGDGTTTNSNIPVSVSGLTSVKQITAGWLHTCALLNSGTVKCWGWNAHGQLGDNSKTDRNTPVNVTGLTGVKQIAAGGLHTCAALDSGTVKCWGSNKLSQLGDGSTTNRNTPVNVTGLIA